MTDQAYLSWSHSLIGGGAATERTPVARAADVYNVKNYGAAGTGSGDDRAAIQAAIDACELTGGIVYFPPGIYPVGSRLFVPANNTSPAITFMGCGGYDGNRGSILTSSAQDYILYASHQVTAGHNVMAIQGLCFKSNYSGSTPTTTEPPNSPDLTGTITSTSSGGGGHIRMAISGLSTVFLVGNFIVGTSIVVSGVTGTPLANGVHTITATDNSTYIEIAVAYVAGPSTGNIAYNGDCAGCLYIGSGIAVVVRDCFFSVNTGVAYCYTGFQGCLENFDIEGGHAPGGNTNKSIGIMTRGTNIRNGKIGALGTGIALYRGPSKIDYLDIENCGIGVLVGNTPLAYYESDTYTVTAAGNNPCGHTDISNLTMESNTDTGIYLYNFAGSIRNTSIAALDPTHSPNYGIRCGLAQPGEFYACEVSGKYAVAAFDVTGFTAGVAYFCTASQTGGAGVPWLLPTSQMANTGGVRFIAGTDNTAGTGFDGALTLALMPAAATFGAEMVCSDSTVAAYAAGVSNYGKTIVGTGANKVIARWNGTAWAIAG